MAYIGRGLVGVLSENRAIDTMSNPNGVVNTMTLSRTPGSVNNVEIYIDGVFQTPGDEYTLVDDVITFTTAPATNAIVIAVVGNDSTIANIEDNTITGAMLPDGSINDSKISSIDSSKISGTLPALDGSSLTDLNINNITGTFPALDGSSLTGIESFRKHASDPLITSNGNQGDVWVNTTNGEMYVLTDATTNANIWTNVGGGSGDIRANILPGPPDSSFPATIPQTLSINHIFTGGTDTGSSNTDIPGAVTHYVVDQISNASLQVATAEVAVGQPHVFTAGSVSSDTNVTFRVRTKDNDGGYSTGVTMSTTVEVDVPYNLHFLVVAGGGGGGGNIGGGGGAGGARQSWNNETSGGGAASESNLVLTENTVYTVTVGAGGAGADGSLSGHGSQGSASSFTGSDITDINTTGGGGGGSYNSNASGSSGGSGGGGGSTDGGGSSGGSGTANQGYDGAGGNSYDTPGGNNTGGGGGAGEAGEANSGGDGIISTITGSSLYWAGGGAPSKYDQGDSYGGLGGGGGGGSGNGSYYDLGVNTGGGSALNPGETPQTGIVGGNGGENTGGGGGGGNYGGYPPSGGLGGLGGKGVVILRIPTLKYSGTITGSPTVTTDGGETILMYTSSGTYTA